MFGTPCIFYPLRATMLMVVGWGLWGIVMVPESRGAVVSSLADLSIEELMNEPVTSVSKKESRLGSVASAVTVVTEEDLRRQGITSVAEGLRLVPGLNVARMDADDWAISARGFNFAYANKLLVLMDGRSVYTPAFAGVYWAPQDMMIEDLERIEVIRGPGATLWGANAVNGVVNITSKSSKDTQGYLFSTSTGTIERAGGAVRYGGKKGEDFHYRTYFKYADLDGMRNLAGGAAGDGWEKLRTGFRADWDATPDDLVTIQGNIGRLSSMENVSVPKFVLPYTERRRVANQSDGLDLMGRWTRTYSSNSHLMVQSYFDSYHMESGLKQESRRTGDVQIEHRFPVGRRNDVIWGIGHRSSWDRFTESEVIRWQVPERRLDLYNVFVQDEIELLPQLHFTAGSKFEHNDYTGWETQPGIRMAWTPTPRQTLWAAVSRAVSTPSRVGREGQVNLAVSQPENSPIPVQSALFGNGGVDSETLLAFELGYRMEISPSVSLDVATFHNEYDDLRAITGLARGPVRLGEDPVPHLIVPLLLGNGQSGETEGGEVSLQWKPTDWWRLVMSYSLYRTHLHPTERALGSPQQQAGVQSYMTLPWDLELNGAVQWVDEIMPLQLDGSVVEIPSYLRMDLGIIWHVRSDLEVGVWGQNLLDGEHPEFVGLNTRQITEIPRSLLLKLTWNF